MSRNTPVRVSAASRTLKSLRAADEKSPSLGFVRFMLQGFHRAISNTDPNSGEEFGRIIGLASEFRLLAMSQKELASHLMVTAISLQRWMEGCSLPTPIVRKAYLAELAVLVQAQLESLPAAEVPRARSVKAGELGGSVVPLTRKS